MKLFFILLLISSYAHCYEFNKFGFTWITKDGFSKPGPNFWSSDNVLNTNEGIVFLLSKNDSKYYSSYAYTKEFFHFGIYEFKIYADLKNIDSSIVISPYLYPDKSIAPDRTHEIDFVEISKWGNKNAPLINFTIWPNILGLPPLFKKSSSEENLLTIKVLWAPEKVLFTSSNGAIMEITDSNYIPTKPMKLFFNLRLLEGRPSNLSFETYAVTLKEFKFIPL